MYRIVEQSYNRFQIGLPIFPYLHNPSKRQMQYRERATGLIAIITTYNVKSFGLIKS